MTELESRFKPKMPELPPSEKLRDFYAENPNFYISKSIDFLIDEYPNIDNWIVHSGVAIQLLGAQRSVEPSDIDILCREDDMEKDFGRWDGRDSRWTRYIDAKSISKWLKGRGQNAEGKTVWELILDTSLIAENNGRQFRIMHPAIIAAEKSTLAKIAPREKDYKDVAALNVSDIELQAATNVVKGIDINRSLNVLKS